MKRMFIGAMIASVATVTAAPALAYVGPGAGLSMLGALWGLLVAVVVAVGFVIAWPLRRYFRRARTQTADTASPQAQADGRVGAEGERAQRTSADEPTR